MKFMKTKLKLCLVIVIGCVLTGLLHAAFPPNQTISMVIVTNTVPQVLGTNTLHFHKIMFVGVKAPRTNNTAIVYIQFNSTNDAPGIPLAAGAVSSVFESEKGFDASDFYIDGTDGDGVTAMIWDLF